MKVSIFAILSTLLSLIPSFSGIAQLKDSDASYSVFDSLTNRVNLKSFPSTVIKDTISIGTWEDSFNTPVGLDETYSLNFSLKYKGINTQTISYTPSDVLLKGHSKENLLLDSLKGIFKNSTSVLRLETNYVINNPCKVSYLWSEIPEPSKLLERGYMRRKSAQEETRKGLISLKDEDKKTLTLKKAVLNSWTFSGVEYLQLQEVGHINWTKSGEDNLTFLNDLRLKLLYKYKKVEWESFIISKMGISVDKESGTKLNDDLFELNTKYGYKASQNWFYSANANLKTQLFYDSYTDDAGLKHYKSGFLSPGYFTAALGMDYKPSSNFSMLLSPLTSKITFLTDTINIKPSDFDLPPGKKTKQQVGFSVNSTFKIPITTLITFRTRLEIFKDYIKRYNSWYFDMENILDLRINRYLTARINMEWRYSEIESSSLQFKENIQIGFTYNL